MRYIRPFISKARRWARECVMLAYLVRAGAGAAAHRRQSLLAHLYGTYRLLRAWGCDDAVCYAGLFHSVYGTRWYHRKTIPVSERAAVRRLAGERAEGLAYLFCVSDRPKVLAEAISSGRLRDRHTGQETTVDARTLADLVALECANLLDQGAPSDPFFGRARVALASSPLPLEEPVRAVLESHKGSSGLS